MELRVYKTCEANSLQIFITNYTDAQFVLSLQSTLSTPCSYLNEYKEAENKRKKKRQKESWLVSWLVVLGLPGL